MLFDGTESITTKWYPAPGMPKVYRTRVPNPSPVQVFVDGVMQTYARWPNMAFYDKSEYEGPERWAHSVISRGGKTSQHDVDTLEGILLDAGACPPNYPCCDECNQNDLAKSGSFPI